MPILSGNCANAKPIVDVVLAAVPPDPGALQGLFDAPSINYVPLKALLDTGADGTSICSRVTQYLSPVNYTGKRNVVGVAGPHKHRTWTTFIGFLYPSEHGGGTGLYMVPDALLAVEIPDNGWFDIIIGRDVLTRFEFVIKPGGRFELILA
jgi:Retroviral aspartyl protease